MSRLTDLLSKVRKYSPDIATELEREFKILSSRRAFGLNFERHKPEEVELPRRNVKRGDKVRILPKRKSNQKKNESLWTIKKISKQDSKNIATLLRSDSEKIIEKKISTDDLVVVAEFRDPIFPGLVSTGKIVRGGDKPFHSIINGENFHTLKALTFTHRGKIDVIYIDPPYNSGAKDWKYNNHYVESEDLYRHSKWLAFMERRLKVAKELLNPANSALIVTIDEKEVHRIGLLLEQIFPDSNHQMVTSIINPRGVYREGEFARSDEYIMFVFIGTAKVLAEPDEDFSEGVEVTWRTLRRSDLTSARGTPKGGKAQFYPIYIDTSSNKIKKIGEALPHNVDRNKAPKVKGCIPVFPMRDDETEMNWGLTGDSLKILLSQGFVKVGAYRPEKPQKYVISYLTSGRIQDIKTGRAKIVGHDKTGAVIAKYETGKLKMPTSCWNRPSHNAETCGSSIVKSLLEDKRFPFPKSLYAVEDCLRFFVRDNKHATILDFFSGSGTTAHAVMRLNKQDNGSRQCISITNNEVSAKEHYDLSQKNLRPGDPDWEKWGICEYVTKPRIKAAIEGKTPNGKPIKGEYKFLDIFPMKDGFMENAEFFDLTYESSISISHNLAFKKIACLLWMCAGAKGKRIEKIPKEGWGVTDTYGILFDLDCSSVFCRKIKNNINIKSVFVVTDDEKRFQAVVKKIPSYVKTLRLYETYLRNFQFSNGEN